MRSDRLHETLLPKRIALPVFASDALSSVAYAPDEIFLTLGIAGFSAYSFSWKVGIAVALVMLVVVASYRQNVHAYPSGGGDYEVATVNLGMTPGLTVASALLVDYVLTVAVSISSAAQYAASTIDSFAGHEVAIAVIAVVLLSAANLRGVRESGTAFAVPTYAFMFAILGTAAFGFFRLASGNLPQVESHIFTCIPRPVLHGDRGPGRSVPAAAGLLVGLRGADRCRGDQQRCPRVPEAEVEERRNHAAAAGHDRRDDDAQHHRAGQEDGAAFRPGPRRPSCCTDGRVRRRRFDGTHYADPVIGQIAKAVFDNAPLLAGC